MPLDFKFEIESAISKALKEAEAEEKVVDLEGFMRLRKCALILGEITGMKPKLSLGNGMFTSGDACVRVQKFNLNPEDRDLISDLVGTCGNVTFDPLINGQTDISVTVPMVLKAKTN